MKEINYKKRILITGGAGYVGSTLIRDCLEEGLIVRCLDLLIYDGRPIVGFINHPNFEFIRGDIRDAEILRKALKDIDCVVHLAAIVGDIPCRAAPKSTVQINFQGTKLIADLSKEIQSEIKRISEISTEERKRRIVCLLNAIIINSSWADKPLRVLGEEDAPVSEQEVMDAGTLLGNEIGKYLDRLQN